WLEPHWGALLIRGCEHGVLTGNTFNHVSLSLDSCSADVSDNSFEETELTAVTLDGSMTALFQGISIDGAVEGFSVGDEVEAEIRGTFQNVQHAVSACNWGSTCSVDAAYVDWSEEDGPTSPELVCGAVATSPYLYEGSAHEGGAGSQNCDNSPTPWEQLDSGQEAFNERIAEAEATCAELGDDVCEAISTAFNCLSAAFDLGAGQLPFALPNPFSGGVSGSDWKTAATTTGSAGAQWLSDSADPVVAGIGKVATRGFQILGLAGTFISLAQAYNQCAP
ncbi:MAG TPA: hypothetical protein VF245_00695, partial [Solirubrobacterales bacterium]